MNENERIRKILQGFIREIMDCCSSESAREIQGRINQFYMDHDVPAEIDVLDQSGMCEMLAMLALE